MVIDRKLAFGSYFFSVMIKIDATDWFRMRDRGSPKSFESCMLFAKPSQSRLPLPDPGCPPHLSLPIQYLKA